MRGELPADYGPRRAALLEHIEKLDGKVSAATRDVLTELVQLATPEPFAVQPPFAATALTPLWMQNETYPANIDRGLIAALFPNGGVLSSGAFRVSERAAGSNMSVDVAAGMAVVPGTDSPYQGGYLPQSTAVLNVVVGGAPAGGFARMDAVVLRVYDQAVVGGSYASKPPWDIEVLQGANTPVGTTPVAPPTPASALLLATISVPAGVSSVVQATITDSRLRIGAIGTAAPGDLSVSARSTPPPGKLLCDGSAVSRTTYAALFEAIGTAWGAGDGTLTFNVPNLQGRVMVGAGAGAGLTARTLAQLGGEELHALTLAELAQHNHGYTWGRNAGHGHPAGGSSTAIVSINAGSTQGLMANPSGLRAWGEGTTGSDNADHAHGTNNAGGGTPHNVMQPYAVVNVFIQT